MPLYILQDNYVYVNTERMDIMAGINNVNGLNFGQNDLKLKNPKKFQKLEEESPFKDTNSVHIYVGKGDDGIDKITNEDDKDKNTYIHVWNEEKKEYEEKIVLPPGSKLDFNW